MSKLRLVHWKVEEAAEGIRTLMEAGFDVHSDPPRGSRFLKELEEEEPDAIIIDLTRIPSQGRDVAVAIRNRRGTRYIPIIFVGGDPEKVKRLQDLLPDAVYSGWDGIVDAIEKAIDASVGNVVVPDSVFAAYAGKPLVEKLGIKASNTVRHVGSPDDFVVALGELPPDVVLVTDPDAQADLTLWFLHSKEELASVLSAIVQMAKRTPVWLAWPKQGSVYEGDLTQQSVREQAMQVGLVDYKICSIDHNWSALLFTWRGMVD
jgi:CheY-like chemotaxis protein